MLDYPRAYNGKEPYIFISYSHRDMDLVLPVISQMMRDGYRVWYDDGIDPGTEWDAMIAAHVRSCGYLIAFISDNYLSSDNCKDELNFARDLGKQRLLVYLKDVALPDGMAMRLSRLQAIHKYTYTNDAVFFEKLYSANGLAVCRGAASVPQEPAVAPEAQKTAPAAPSVPSPAQPVRQKETADDLYRKGKAAFDRGDYTDAIKPLRQAAEAGHTDGQYLYGICQYHGHGVAKNQPKAYELWKKAAGHGHAQAIQEVMNAYTRPDYYRVQDYSDAQAMLRLANTSVEDQFQKAKDLYEKKDFEHAVLRFRLAANCGHVEGQHRYAWCLFYGEGIQKDYKEAVAWWRKAAEAGHMKAQYNLGICYKQGEGVDLDYTEALRWYRKAAAQGYSLAQNNIGGCYTRGTGVQQDYAEALKWYRLAAEQGNNKAQRNLGICYENGEGVPQDYGKALEWYTKAAENGHPKAKEDALRCHIKLYGY